MALIREAVKTKKDVETLHPLIEEIWSEVFTPIIGNEQVNYMLDTYQSIDTILQEIEEGTNYFLLLDEQVPVGYTAYSLTEADLYISKIYLKQSLRGKGYSSAIFAWYEELAKQSGLNKLRLRVNQGNERAIQVYEHKGFKNVHFQVVEIGSDFVMDDYIFEKVLA